MGAKVGRPNSRDKRRVRVEPARQCGPAKESDLVGHVCGEGCEHMGDEVVPSDLVVVDYPMSQAVPEHASSPRTARLNVPGDQLDYRLRKDRQASNSASRAF